MLALANLSFTSIPFASLPFSGGLSATPNGYLMFSIGAALLYGLLLSSPPSPRRAIVKTLSIGILAVLAFYVGGPWALILALSFSALGDAFLAYKGDKNFLGGLASFLVAHIFYVILFVTQPTQTLIFQTPRLAAIIAMLAFCGLMLFKLLPAVGSLKLPVLAYMLVITIMGVVAMGLDKPMAILGAIMFIASDAVLATEKFLMSKDHPLRTLSSIAIWTLYYIGQLLIALAFLA